MKNLFSLAFVAVFSFTLPNFQPKNVQNLPDLEVTDVQLVCNGSDRKIVVTITNIGQGRPNRRVAIAVRGQNNESKRCVQQGAVRDIEVIRAGKVCVLEFPLKNNPNCDCNNNLLSFEVCADPDRLIQDADRSNNKKVFNFNI